MSRLIIVSNRLPITVQKNGGELNFKPSVGGLATGLSSIYKAYNGFWIGWPGLPTEEIQEDKSSIEDYLDKEALYPVYLTQNEIDEFYSGFSNDTIWPLFHYFPQYTTYNNKFWETYKRVNEQYCEEVIKRAHSGDMIWIQDYHLMLLPKMLREANSSLQIGFFLHIPFPSFETFRLLPWRDEIIEGMLGSDLIGFHIYDYVRHFLSSVRRLIGLETSLNHITYNNRIIQVDAFPIGIDYEKFANAISLKKTKLEIKKIHKEMGNRKIILSVDRLDYSKGIPQRLDAFDRFLEKYPEYREKVSIILVVVPSRTDVEHYRMLKSHIEEQLANINGKYNTIGWVSIWYMFRSFPFEELVAMYNAADVALLTPMRDGMNLVAKEFVAAKDNTGKGVLIISEMAGAAVELGEAIIVNPNNSEQIADALKMAMEMPEKEQIERNRVMQQRLKRYHIKRWAEDFVEHLKQVMKLQDELRSTLITEDFQKKLIYEFFSHQSRLLLLDYDGTLVSFADRPEKAIPDRKLLELFRTLSKIPNTDIAIVSGRDKDTLSHWFSNENLHLAAEHGVWLKEKGGEWQLIEPMVNDWKDEIRPILEFYTDRAPLSLIEEKDYSLVWHYRRVEPEKGEVRAREVKESLRQLTANLNLEILEGNKVLEVKNSGINKGRIALHFLHKKSYDFIMAIGDDWTDEYMFDALPKEAYTIKVGLKGSYAQYKLESVNQVRQLLYDIKKGFENA